MDDTSASHKKRRHDSHYSSSDYHQRYKKHIGNQRDDWRSGGSFREKDGRYAERQDRGRVGNQYRDPGDTLWDVEINLIGQKDPNPMIHLCDTCRLPIRSYGRLIPCKHVFCFKCAKKTDKNCPRCVDEVHRIEQCRHGTVWMCSVANCSRTYLSQRDLQAHVNHRHSKPPPPPNLPAITVPPPQLPGAILVPPPSVPNIPQLPNHGQVAPYVLMPNVSANQPPPPISIQTQGGQAISTSQPVDIPARPSSNLITIQIQDDQQNTPSSFGQSTGHAQQTTLYSTASTAASPQITQARSNTDVASQWAAPRAGRTQNRSSNY